MNFQNNQVINNNKNLNKQWNFIQKMFPLNKHKMFLTNKNNICRSISIIKIIMVNIQIHLLSKLMEQ